MKLTQIFSGETHVDGRHSVDSQGHIQQTPAQTENINRQIRSLVPGQTISGEIVSRNGGEVQIKVSEDMILNARVDRSLNLEIGKNMTFEVKNNGSALTLSPLFTNVSTDMNVLKALDMAGLPVNQTSVSMTQQLMAAGMPVNRSALQQVLREINSFPQSEISDIINLHKLQMPVNEANINQMAAYRNLTHQLTDGMNTILGALPEVLDAMAENGNGADAAKLYQELLSLVGEGEPAKQMKLQEGQTGAAAEGTDTAAAQGTAQHMESGGQISGQNVLNPEASLRNMLQGELLEQGILSQNMSADGGLEELYSMEQGASGQSGQAGMPETVSQSAEQNLAFSELPAGEEAEAISDSLRGAVAKELLQLLDSTRMTGQEAAQLRGQVMQFAQGQADAGRLFSALQNLGAGGLSLTGGEHFMEKLFSGKNFRQLLTGQLKKLWTVSPREVAEPGGVEELYRRMDRQLKSLAQALENAGQTNSTAFKAASSMSQNIDFLQQVNQMYTYIQLPIRLQQREAHGELYVYSNKKKITSRDGKISALLHLDMDNLGPVDVYVAMQSSKVSTRFYLQDEDMIDFISGHMDMLTQRLRKRGYDCSFAMTVRGEAEEAVKGGLEPILGREKGTVLSHYAFDVRT